MNIEDCIHYTGLGESLVYYTGILAYCLGLTNRTILITSNKLLLRLNCFTVYTDD